MGRHRIWFLTLAAVAAGVTAAAAQDRNATDPPPSLEYRPPRPIVPEPKEPRPLPPITMFREAIGGFGMTTGSFNRPMDVARDADGNFYVLDGGNNRVQKFDRNSNPVAACGSSGMHDGEFNQPTAIAIHGDQDPKLYIVDTGNHRIQICGIAEMFGTRGGACECDSWGTLGSGTPSVPERADFKSPRDIAFDGCGGADRDRDNIYVLDSGNDRVQIFDYKRTFQNKWDGSFGTTGGKFDDLTSIAWSDERMGYIYLLGPGCVVQQFKPDRCDGGIDGTLVRSWPAIAPDSGLCVPARIEIDERNDYVYVLDSGNGLLMSFNPDGMYRWSLHEAQVTFSGPLGFAVDANGGEFLIADTENNIVQKFTLR